MRIEPKVAQLATGVALLDADLRLVYLNPALIESLGLAGMRYLGATLLVLSPDAEFLADAARRAIDEQRLLRLRNCLLGMHAGHQFRADVSLGPVSAGVLLEVHALASVEESAPDVRLSASLRGLAHEVKNPLAGVRGAAQLLARHLSGNAELAKLAEIIIAEADRLTGLADRLLRADGATSLAPINIHEIIERVRILVLAEADQSVRIERDYDPSLPPVQADSDRLLQLLLNLVRNALQANAQVIRLRTRIDYGTPLATHAARLALRVDVIDDGDGVPDGLQPTLFQPLVSGRIEGTGLGLSLAQEIAHEHGGVITCYSNAGHTVFTLTLPLGEPHG